MAALPAEMTKSAGSIIGNGLQVAERRATYDHAASVATLTKNAKAHSEHHCSYFVAVAVNAGLPDGTKKLVVDHTRKWGPANGGLMGPKLTSVGFHEQVGKGYSPKTGDVAVIAHGKGAGHVAMWSGKEWISDFRQGASANPYRDKKLPVRYFRHP